MIKKKRHELNPLLILKGFLMGLFDVIPGISGGSIALITKIYETLIQEINNFFEIIKNITTPFFKEKLKETNFYFLITIFTGIILGIIVSVFGMKFLLNNYFAQTMGAITGIILVSGTNLLSKYLTKKNTYVSALGAIIGISISLLTPLSGHEFSYLGVFFLGLITITAMILPGISGALILLLLGGYEFMINALTNASTEYLNIVSFIIGAFAGLFIFVKTINYLLKKHHDKTLVFLTGLMIGAITKPIIEIMNTNNSLMSIPFFLLAGILSFFIIKKI